MSASRMTIGTLSAHAHCAVPTIRYYEQIGLLPRPQRAANGHRFYGDAALKRLTFIRRCRDFGFPIEQVRDLAALFEDGDRACVEVRDAASAHLVQVRVKLEEMRQLAASLEAFVHSCDSDCSGGKTRDCVIISDMAMRGCGAPIGAAPDIHCAVSESGAAATLIATEIRRK